ncbi:MAG: RsmB/NOP family class I SAM-dependent RNA methyltransferase [Lactobacillus sp.]|jgi:NOL1/NOP2/sun family putative RNA methylase|nr:RsmB/NOP family class I SAM-dependent RNA methyltransferase [Lactobacillus sp.]
MLPDAFKDKYQTLLGSAAPAFFAALTTGQVKKAFRINSLKASGAKTLALDRPVPGLRNAYYGQVHDISSDWVSGTVYSQEPAAMFPAACAQVKPGERVLDLCAAPGGKSTALAEQLQGQGVLVANEINAKRAKTLRENLERWGAVNTVVVNNRPDELAAHFPHYFDCILVDAPCSGEGMFRKDPAAIQYWSPDYVQTCQARQKKILASAMAMLAPHGRLIYSTCTFSPEEDEQVVDWLLQHYDLQLQSVDLAVASPGRPDWAPSGNPDLKKTVRFWPQAGIGEGQFLAVLKQIKAPASANAAAKPVKRKRQRQRSSLNKPEQALIEKTLQLFNLPAGLNLNVKDWQNRRGHIGAPVLPPDQLTGLHVLVNGAELGQLKPHRFVPSQQLAQILGQKSQTQAVDLPDAASFKRYLHGETLKVTSSLRGFVLVSYQGEIFSFGKLGNDGILKNFYPKGLRH